MPVVSVGEILSKLPTSKGEFELIKKRQYVPDIINEICTAHRLNARLYDRFSYLFYDTDAEVVAETLHDFCRRNIEYAEETVHMQTSLLPQGILSDGFGDCKHYALFCGGVLGSLNRLYGCGIPWEYFFAGYNGAKEPYHVFVTVDYEDTELWLDPTPGSGGTPSVFEKRRV